MGSNACVFISLHAGKQIVQGGIEWPQGDEISNTSIKGYESAMLKGNMIHDDLFDLSPVNVDVDDAIVMAGEECCVLTVDYQTDIFGRNPRRQLLSLFQREAEKKEEGFTVFVADERALLLAVSADKSAMILDSHRHPHGGAVIAFSNDAAELTQWLLEMMVDDWQYDFRIGKAHKIVYDTP